MWAGQDKLSFEINAVQGSGKEQHDRNSHPIQLSSLYSVPRPVLGHYPCASPPEIGARFVPEGTTLAQESGPLQTWAVMVSGLCSPVSRGHSTTKSWEQRTERREDANMRLLLGSCRIMGNQQLAAVSSPLKVYVFLSSRQPCLLPLSGLEAPPIWLDNGQHTRQHTLS